MKKCDTCEIMKLVLKAREPAVCAWYIDNVVVGNKKVEDCTMYVKESTYAEN